MPHKLLDQFRGMHASKVFGWLMAIFMLIFSAVVLLAGLDQDRVLSGTQNLQDKTVPEILRYQRLGRNIEQLRQEGERFFSATTPQMRQQALFVATLVASHPSVLEHQATAELAAQIEQFLANTSRQLATDPDALLKNYDAWQLLSARCSLLVDDVSIVGVSLARKDLSEVHAAMKTSQLKLRLALIVVGVFAIAFLMLLHRHLIRPLQKIDRALNDLSVSQPAPVFELSAMVEIQVVEAAIGELHASLLENETARQSLETLANRDGLTGLTNRRHFMHVANAELQRAQRYERPVTIGMADLDYFKKLNDTYGHAAGDAVLRSFAALMQDTLRQSDLVCRYGGEEFAFLFPESSLAETQQLAERFRALVSDYDIRLSDGRLVRVTMSIGLADASNCPMEVALKRADEALYEAKRLGRNRVVVAEPVDLG
jgi:diguanylate cyclase (GGDEF)-like protein